MTMTDIQDSYVCRVLLASSKLNERTKGYRFERSVRAARKEAKRRLLSLGLHEADAKVVIRDAHDMFELERGAKCT